MSLKKSRFSKIIKILTGLFSYEDHKKERKLLFVCTWSRNSFFVLLHQCLEKKRVTNNPCNCMCACMHACAVSSTEGRNSSRSSEINICTHMGEIFVFVLACSFHSCKFLSIWVGMRYVPLCGRGSSRGSVGRKCILDDSFATYYSTRMGCMQPAQS